MRGQGGSCDPLQWMLAYGVWGLCASEVLPAQVTSSASQPLVRDTAGPQHRAGALHRTVLGGNWRELWQSPLDVPVLTLRTFGGGLIPVREGGNQSRTLHVDGGDGRRYVFRTVGKRPGDSVCRRVDGNRGVWGSNG